MNPYPFVPYSPVPYQPPQQWQQNQQWQTQQWQAPVQQVTVQPQPYAMEQTVQYQAHTRTVALPAPHNPTPPPANSKSAMIDIYAGPNRNKISVHEKVLMRYKYFSDGINRMRSISNGKGKMEFEFANLDFQGVSDVALKWMYNKPLALFVSESGHIKSSLITEIWKVSETWNIPKIRKDIMDTLSNEIKREGVVSTEDLIGIMKALFARSTLEDQNMICDVLRMAIGRLAPLQWYAAIKADKNPHPVFYQRLAGLVFLSVTLCLCGHPDCRLGRMDKRHCAVCSKKINKTENF
ncbi:hypothetical protein TWF694_005771 [Orbilia ellipsospora]|uniref:BTB domain-containing protein n=1 Tax=Orbilia ellipsospora TaxID=2528407 RepID=A0AAV9WRZ8_9PEZI